MDRVSGPRSTHRDAPRVHVTDGVSQVRGLAGALRFGDLDDLWGPVDGIESPSPVITGSILGTVTRSDGESVAGLRVCLARSRDGWRNAESDVIDEAGSFRFEVPADQKYWLYVDLGSARFSSQALRAARRWWLLRFAARIP